MTFEEWWEKEAGIFLDDKAVTNLAYEAWAAGHEQGQDDAAGSEESIVHGG